MEKIDVKALTIKQAHDHLARGDFSAMELTHVYLDEIDKKNKNVNAYLEVFDDAMEQAKMSQKIFDNKQDDVLTGIPLAIKDNILIKGRKVSAASKILEGYSAVYDATVIERLKKSGAVFLGRTNLDEFAMGSSTENSAFGVTKNPHDETRVAGGSSGGSAAAVASDMALGGLGSDTGGSVRQPASYCGVVGLKPTYGRVSRYGLIAMGSSLDQIGPIAKNVEDAEILFNAVSGKDSYDSTSRDFDETRSVKDKFVIGIPRQFTNQRGVDNSVSKNFEEAEKIFSGLGCEIRDVSMPNIKYSLAVYYIIMPAEASSNLARFDGVKYGLHKDGKNLMDDYLETRGKGFGREVRRRIVLGTYVLSSGYYDEYYYRANDVRRVISDEFRKCFDGGVDVILTPTAPSPAFKIGEKVSDPLSMYLADIFTVTANIVGVPAISIPSGFAEVGSKRLPLGVQLTSNFGWEDIIFTVGKSFEKALK